MSEFNVFWIPIIAGAELPLKPVVALTKRKRSVLVGILEEINGEVYLSAKGSLTKGITHYVLESDLIKLLNPTT